MGVSAIISPSPDPALAFPDAAAETKRLNPIEHVERTSRKEESNPDPSSQDPSRKNLQESEGPFDSLSRKLNLQPASELSISVDRETKKIVVKVLNSATKEVIRQIPPEELVELSAKLGRLNGSLFDEVA
ncbi:MAG: flagellar protein FlaG [Acidobacteriota bacterium]